MTASARWALATLALFAAVACFGGCQTIYGIGDLPHAGGDAQADAGTCTTVTTVEPPDAGDVACPVVGACSPGDVSGYSTPWIPPVDRKNQCTTLQLDGYFANCIDPTTATAQKCDSWTAAAANATCYGCVLVDKTAEKWGAAVRIEGTNSFKVNRPGCIALAEPCNIACAQALLAQILCSYKACDPTDAGNCWGSGDTKLNTCVARATVDKGIGTACACQGYTAAAACADSLTGLAAEKCSTPNSDAIPLYKKVATFMCGPF